MTIGITYTTTDGREFRGDGAEADAKAHQALLDKIARWCNAEQIPDTRRKLMTARIVSWIEFDGATVASE